MGFSPTDKNIFWWVKTQWGFAILPHELKLVAISFFNTLLGIKYFNFIQLLKAHQVSIFLHRIKFSQTKIGVNNMKHHMLVLSVIVALAAATLFAGSPPGDSKSERGLEKLKSLAGTWNGKDNDGNPVTLSYKIVSDGTSLMESLDMGENKGAMITMYHLNGNKLMMTHYCSMGNQPRMTADGLSGDGKSMNFKFVDATNLASKKDSHMRKLIFTFTDEDHITQEWTALMEGKMDHVAKFEFERAK